MNNPNINEQKKICDSFNLTRKNEYFKKLSSFPKIEYRKYAKNVTILE